MMNNFLTCSSTGWLMIVTSLVLYTAAGLATFSLIKGLFSGSAATRTTGSN